MAAIKTASKRVNDLFRRGAAIAYQPHYTTQFELSPEAALVLSQIKYWYSLRVDSEGFLNERDFRFRERPSDTQYTIHQRSLIRTRCKYVTARPCNDVFSTAEDWHEMQDAYTEHCRQVELRRVGSTEFSPSAYEATKEYIQARLHGCMFAAADSWRGWEAQLGLQRRQIKRLFQHLQEVGWISWHRDGATVVVLPADRFRLDERLADQIEMTPARVRRRRQPSLQRVDGHESVEVADHATSVSGKGQILLPPRLVAACDHNVAPALLIQQSLHMLRLDSTKSTWYRTDAELFEYMHLTRKQLERARRWLGERSLMRFELRFARRRGPMRRATHYTLDLSALDRVLGELEADHQESINS